MRNEAATGESEGIMETHTETASATGEATTSEAATATEKATFGAGCFWQVETAFRELDGVVGTAVGYEGGTVDNPTYEQVCSDRTGHAEVAQVEFDPERISYEELLEKFWAIHDPTQLNRQGPDVGAQYRSVIFTHSEAQAEAARASKQRAQEGFRQPIVTEIAPAQPFWRAEEYHQCYLQKRQERPGLLASLLGR
jgi:peptide-methionine (S)-S-oxide reductase